MIVRRRDSHEKIAELESELTASEKLIVLPAIHIVIGGHSRIPLGELVDICSIRKDLVPRPTAVNACVVDLVIPVDRKDIRPAGCKWSLHIDPQHCLVENVAKRVAFGIADVHQVDAPIECSVYELVELT